MSDLKKYRQVHPEVFYPKDNMVMFAPDDIEALIRTSAGNDRNRARICAHASPDSDVHEMLIAHHQSCYVRPHKHVGKTEAMQVLQGEVLAVRFTPDGKISDATMMGSYSSGLPFYCRMSESTYHMLIILSEWLVFMETTKGPFCLEDTQFPDWAPDGCDLDLAKAYVTDIDAQVKAKTTINLIATESCHE